MRVGLLLAGAAVAALAGCAGDRSVGPTSGRLAITAPGGTELTEGQTVALGVRSNGATLEPSSVRWTSRDPSTLTVKDGIVHAVAAGPAWVVAEQGEARDSVQVTAHFSSVGSGGAALRFLGAPGAPMRLRGAGLLSEVMVSGWSHTVLQASNIDVGSEIGNAYWGDTTLMIMRPGKLAEGPIKVPAFENIVTTNGLGWGGAGGGIVLRIREGSSKFKFYFAVDSSPVLIKSAVYPANPGRVPGLITGAVTFVAAGLQFDVDAAGKPFVVPIGDTTATIYAEFATPVWHVLQPMFTESKWEGTPPYHAPDRANPGGHAKIVNGALAMRLFSFIGQSTTPDAQIGEGWVWVPTPALGTVALDSVGPSKMADSTSGAKPWVWFRFVSPAQNTWPLPWYHSFSEKGSLTITAYRAPTATDFGEVRGTLVMTQRFWRNGAPTADATTGTLTFVLPVEPLDGSPLPRNGGGG